MPLPFDRLEDRILVEQIRVDKDHLVVLQDHLLSSKEIIQKTEAALAESYALLQSKPKGK